jgi:hypothetical protein
MLTGLVVPFLPEFALYRIRQAEIQSFGAVRFMKGPTTMALTNNAAVDRPPLTPKFCQDLVVRNTPLPERFKNNPEQDLSELGVDDKEQAAQHKSNIQADLHANQYGIKQSDIKTGPGVSVHGCSVSVLGHAH